MQVAENCIFCKTEFSKAIFSESENFIIAYNIAPILPGHSLVLPKDHYESLLDLPASQYQEMMSFCVSSVSSLMKIFNADGFDLSIQDGKSAGQTIAHLHIHLIPRSTNDLNSPGEWYPELLQSNQAIIDSDSRQRISAEELDKVVDYLKKKI